MGKSPSRRWQIIGTLQNVQHYCSVAMASESGIWRFDEPYVTNWIVCLGRGLFQAEARENSKGLQGGQACDTPSGDMDGSVFRQTDRPMLSPQARDPPEKEATG